MVCELYFNKAVIKKQTMLQTTALSPGRGKWPLANSRHHILWLWPPEANSFPYAIQTNRIKHIQVEKNYYSPV